MKLAAPCLILAALLYSTTTALPVARTPSISVPRPSVSFSRASTIVTPSIPIGGGKSAGSSGRTAGRIASTLTGIAGKLVHPFTWDVHTRPDEELPFGTEVIPHESMDTPAPSDEDAKNQGDKRKEGLISRAEGGLVADADVDDDVPVDDALEIPDVNEDALGDARIDDGNTAYDDTEVIA